MRKERKDSGRERGAYGRRTDGARTSAMVSAPLLGMLARAWPGRPSHGVRMVLRRVYGPEVPATLPQALYAALPAVDGVRVSLILPDAWLRLCRRERVTLSAVINDALVRVYILGQ